LLQPLPIPDKPWVSFFMDFIIGFSKVDGMNTIMVVVERFTKYAMFVAASTVYKTEVAAELFYRNVVKYVGVSFDIVRYHDVRFNGQILDNIVQHDRNKAEVFHCQSFAN